MIKKIIKKIILRRKYNSETYVKYLKSIGVKIGDNCRFFSPTTTLVDTQNPCMLSIGDNAKITNGVIILTHDYSWSVGSLIYNKTYGNVGRVIIGNNCFIGMNSIILKGSTIGDNVIIGAGSVVSGRLESNSVYAGNPAKKIMTLEEFIKKREEKQISEAVIFANEIKKRRGRHATRDELFEYFWLYSKEELTPRMKSQIKHLGAEKDISCAYYSSNRKPPFNSFEDFLEYCDKQEENGMTNEKK